MKKAMIASVTVLALVVSAGTSVAGPSLGNGQRGIAKQFISTNTRVGNIAKSADMYKSSAQAACSNPSTQLPNVVVIPIEDNGNNTWVFGKTSGTCRTGLSN